MFSWELRYRAPRTVENVRIKTFTSNPAEAKAVADAYLTTLVSPSIRFIYVKPDVVATTADFPEIAKKYGAMVIEGISAADADPAGTAFDPTAASAHARPKPGPKPKIVEQAGA